MDAAEKALLKEKIVVTIAETEIEMARLEEATKPISPENSLGRITRMDAINNKGVADAALRSTKRKMGKLRLALLKIEEPGFGICNRCNKMIASKRLLFMPESTHCVNCAR